MEIIVNRVTIKKKQKDLTFMPTHTHIPETIAGLLLFTTLSATAADLQGHSPPVVSLLKEFRPIGAAGNNLRNPHLNPVPYTPELALTPLNFAPGTNDGLVNGPQPPDHQ